MCRPWHLKRNRYVRRHRGRLSYKAAKHFVFLVPAGDLHGWSDNKSGSAGHAFVITPEPDIQNPGDVAVVNRVCHHTIECAGSNFLLDFR